MAEPPPEVNLTQEVSMTLALEGSETYGRIYLPARVSEGMMMGGVEAELSEPGSGRTIASGEVEPDPGRQFLGPLDRVVGDRPEAGPPQQLD